MSVGNACDKASDSLGGIFCAGKTIVVRILAHLFRLGYKD